MAKFLNSQYNVAELGDLLKSTEKFLIIISPYLKISNNFKQILTSLQKVDCRIIYDARNPLKKEEIDFLKTIKGIRLYNCENLHAKCFINEKSGIITSMNLYEYSQTNNWEMGILFSKKNDPEIYSKVLEDIDFMKNNFKLHDLGLVTQIVDFIAPKSYCIRCKAIIPYNPNHPLCNTCYPKWAQFKRFDYTEKYCHGCGQQFKKLSYANPLCKDCSKN